MALGATTEYYDATEIATQILPHLVALTVDSDSDVRMKAFQATEVFLKTDHLKVVASFPLNKIAVLEIVCLKVVVTFESCRCGACWCITAKLCQTPY